jgi:hypothetical protein
MVKQNEECRLVSLRMRALTFLQPCTPNMRQCSLEELCCFLLCAWGGRARCRYSRCLTTSLPSVVPLSTASRFQRQLSLSEPLSWLVLHTLCGLHCPSSMSKRSAVLAQSWRQSQLHHSRYTCLPCWTRYTPCTPFLAKFLRA